MKRNTPGHPKVEQLAAALNVDLAKAVGTLELLWHFTAQYCPAGDIGAYPDDIIASRVSWSGCAETLVCALVDAHFLDIDDAHRLIVHDWFEHCEDSVHIRLARNAQVFADGRVPRLNRIPKNERAEIESQYAQKAHKKRTKSALPKPPPMPKPSQAKECAQTAFDSFWKAYPKKKSRGRAEALWAKINPDDETVKTIIAAVEAQKNQRDWKKENGKYIPYPATWLNAQGWLDEVTTISDDIAVPSPDTRDLF